MPPTILVPLDGSPEAEQALPWAMSLAVHTSATLRTVGVHAPPAIYLDGQTLVGSATPDDEVRAQEEQYLDDVETRVRVASGVAITADLIDGNVLEALQQHTQAVQPAYVVMTAHGRSTIARFFLGSTAIDYLRTATVPVLLVHTTTTEQPDLTTRPTIKRIVLPLDGSKLAEQSIATAFALGRLFNASYHFLMVLDTRPDSEMFATLHEPTTGPDDEQAVASMALRYLEHMADRLREQGHTATTELVKHGSAVDGILAAARAEPDTLVALVTHGRGGLAKLVWGSVTERVMQHTPVPLLIVRVKSAIDGDGQPA